jgi:CRP/FNR family transcriptional regulator, cyclic AMP receptor protein
MMHTSTTTHAHNGRRGSWPAIPPDGRVRRAAGARGHISLVDADPELFENLDGGAFEQARRVAVAEVRTLKPGLCDLALDSSSRPPFGLLILDGVLMRQVEIAGGSCGELVGPGDVLRPWLDCGDSSTLPTRAVWRALVQSSVAVLDDDFTHAVRLWPQVPAALMDRLLMRTRWLEFQLTICRRKPVAERLHVMLWQFAYRWGTVTPDGVALPVPLTHQLLADVVGAERPTVTSALGSLQKDGLIQRIFGGGPRWLLVGEPPAP